MQGGFMIRNKPVSAVTNFSWNAVGSAANTITSLLLLMIVTQVLGVTIAGPFAIAFTTAQILLALGFYGIRNYQVTDISNVYSTGTYISVRIATSGAMICLGWLFCFVSQYDSYKTILFLILIGAKIAESISDVFYGVMQKMGRLYISGISMSVRSVLSVAVFYFSLVLYRNLLLSCSLMMIAAFIPILAIDLPVLHGRDTIRPHFDKKQTLDLLRICFPIFAASILPIIVINLPKYVIDRTMADEYQTIYNIIVMPGTTIILFSQIIIQSLLVALANHRTKEKLRSFVSMINKVILCVVLFTGLCIVLFNYFGRDLLFILYKKDLGAYIPHLLVVIVGAMFCSIAIILSVALTTLRNTKVQLNLFAVNLIAALGISLVLIPRFGLSGAAGSYLLIMFIQWVLYAIVFLRTIYAAKRTPDELA